MITVARRAAISHECRNDRVRRRVESAIGPSARPRAGIAAEFDILAAEAGRYADRLAGAGALVEFRTIAGADHGYDLDDDARCREVYTLIARHIRHAVAGQADGIAD